MFYRMFPLILPIPQLAPHIIISILLIIFPIVYLIPNDYFITIIFFLLNDFIGWHWFTKLYRFQLHSTLTVHCIGCSLPQVLSLLSSPFIPSELTLPNPRQSPHCCLRNYQPWTPLIFIINFSEWDTHFKVCTIKATLNLSLQYILTDNPLLWWNPMWVNYCWKQRVPLLKSTFPSQNRINERFIRKEILTLKDFAAVFKQIDLQSARISEAGINSR